MSGLIEPTTRSPGHLILYYHNVTTGYEHTTSCRFVAGVDLDVLSLIAGDAEDWAAALQNCMGDIMLITDFGVKDKYGRTVYRAPLGTPRFGLLGGPNYWESYTITAVGRGNSIGAAYAAGVAESRWFSGNGFNPAPHIKELSVPGTTGLLELQSMFNGSTRIFADFYGQKADMRNLAPVQMNAYAQKRRGF